MADLFRALKQEAPDHFKRQNFKMSRDRTGLAKQISNDASLIVHLNGIATLAMIGVGVRFISLMRPISDVMNARFRSLGISNIYKSQFCWSFMPTRLNFSDRPVRNDIHAETPSDVFAVLDAAIEECERMASLEQALVATWEGGLFDGASLYTVPAAALVIGDMALFSKAYEFFHERETRAKIGIVGGSPHGEVGEVDPSVKERAEQLARKATVEYEIDMRAIAERCGRSIL